MDNNLFELIYSIFEESLNKESIISKTGVEVLKTAYGIPKREMSIDYQIEHERYAVLQYISDYQNHLSMAAVIDQILEDNNLTIPKVTKVIDQRVVRQTIYRLADHSHKSSAKKETLICLGFCCNASLGQLEQLLASSGYILAKNNPNDLLVRYCFENQKSIEFYEGMQLELEERSYGC